MTIRRGLFAAALIAATAMSTRTQGLDPGSVTCGGFVVADRADKAALIMWLRGYHAAKSGITDYAAGGRYGAMLGRYCANHPQTKLIEASEQILSELDRGI